MDKAKIKSIGTLNRPAPDLFGQVFEAMVTFDIRLLATKTCTHYIHCKTMDIAKQLKKELNLRNKVGCDRDYYHNITIVKGKHTVSIVNH